MESHLELLSETQATVLDLIDNHKNVTVQANPGSGKTQLILQIASAFPAKNVLVVSFNTALVNDTNTKLQKFADERTGWTAAHTYHGLMGTVVGETVYDDMIFGHFLTSANFEQIGAQWKYRDVELFIIDEAQDLKERLVLFLLIILTAMTSNRDRLQMVLLFDDKQTLYSFYPISKADARFAMLASNIYGPFLADSNFEHVVLPVSYRLTPQSAAFINALVPSRTIMSGHAKEELHNYITLYIADIYRDAAAIVVDIVRREAGAMHNYGDILVLVNSLRSKHSPARAVVDMLVANDIPVHVLRNTKNIHAENAEQPTSSLQGDVRKNKVNFLTDCGAKGLQFRTVIKINESELLSPDYISNARYVALTRHSERLYVVQNARFTTQSQIDNLLSHPKITQRVLRVIVKRQVPIDLPVKKQMREIKANADNPSLPRTITPPAVVECGTLFAFLDIVHMENLMAHVEYERLSQDEFDTIPPGETSIENDFEDPNAVSQYFAMNIIAQNNNTFVDVMRIVNRALMFAIEFFFTRRIPNCIRIIANKTQHSENSVQDRLMWSRLQDAMFGVTRLHDDNLDVFFQHILNSMELFGNFALVHDAYENYRDLLFELTDFQFVCTTPVKSRLCKLRVILESLVARHEKIEMLQWDQLLTGHFVLEDNKLLDVVAHVPILSNDRSFYIFISNEADISNDERLCAMAATMATQTTIQPCLTNMFVISMVTLVVERIELASSSKQPLLLNVESATSPHKAIARYAPCEFLVEALSYKFWSSTENEESDTDLRETSAKRARNDPDYDENDDHAFVASIHNSLQALSKKQKTTTD